jgi:hypothetical protein
MRAKSLAFSIGYMNPSIGLSKKQQSYIEPTLKFQTPIWAIQILEWLIKFQFDPY